MSLDNDFYSLLGNHSDGNITACGEEKLEGFITVGLGVFLAAAAFIAYLPQVVEIIWKRSAEGISYWSIFLAHTASLASLLNGIFIKWDILYCCLHVTAGICAESLLVVISLIVPVIGQTCIWIVVLLFFTRGGDREKRRECRFALFAFIVDWTSGAVASVICAMLLVHHGSSSKSLRVFANALGYAGAALTSVQWVPQIWQTWKAQNRGSLSLIMLSIQCPGSLLIVVYFGIIRHYPVTTWLPYAVASTMQAILISMLLYFHIRDKARGLPADAEVSEPLMPDVIDPSINEDGSRRRF